MDDLLQSQIRESCRLALPEGLKDLMYDISREVLRAKPDNLCRFISEYLAALLVTREHLDIAAHVCGELCNNLCHSLLKDKLRGIGLEDEAIEKAHKIIVDYLETGKGKEVNLMSTLITKVNIEEDMIPGLQKTIRYAYLRQKIQKPCSTDYSVFEDMDDVTRAVHHTLKIYENSKPSKEQYDRMATKIQAAYRGYGVRRSMRVRLDTGSSTNMCQFKDNLKVRSQHSSASKTTSDFKLRVQSTSQSEDSFKKTNFEETERAVFDYSSDTNFYNPKKISFKESNIDAAEKKRDSLTLLRIKRRISEGEDLPKTISFNRYPAFIPNLDGDEKVENSMDEEAKVGDATYNNEEAKLSEYEGEHKKLSYIDEIDENEEIEQNTKYSDEVSVQFNDNNFDIEEEINIVDDFINEIKDIPIMLENIQAEDEVQETLNSTEENQNQDMDDSDQNTKFIEEIDENSKNEMDLKSSTSKEKLPSLAEYETKIVDLLPKISFSDQSSSVKDLNNELEEYEDQYEG